MLPIILVGFEGEKLHAYVTEYAQKNTIPSSNIFHIHPEKSTISIDQVRDIQNMTQRSKSLEMLVVVHNFDTAQNAAQNAFLKTLEEESTHVHFVLIVDDETQVLPTIASRARVERATFEQTQTFPVLKKSSLLTASNAAEWMSASSQLDKEKLTTVFDELVRLFHNKLVDKPNTDNAAAAKAIMEKRQHVKRNNVQPEYAIDMIGLMLDKSDLLPLN